MLFSDRIVNISNEIDKNVNVRGGFLFELKHLLNQQYNKQRLIINLLDLRLQMITVQANQQRNRALGDKQTTK